MKKIIQIIVGIVALLILGFLIININKTKTMDASKPKVAKISNYISEDKSFSFSYPDFEKWNADKPEIIYPNQISNKDFYMTDIVYYSASNTWSGIEPRIRFHRIMSREKSLIGKPNINGVVYNDQDVPGQKVTFQTSSFEVEVSIVAGDVEGFSAQVVLDEIIKSFKI